MSINEKCSASISAGSRQDGMPWTEPLRLSGFSLSAQIDNLYTWFSQICVQPIRFDQPGHGQLGDIQAFD